jgi:hypothetical protein
VRPEVAVCQKPDREGGPHSQVLVLKTSEKACRIPVAYANAALPPDVRKGSAFPASLILNSGEATPRPLQRGVASLLNGDNG